MLCSFVIPWTTFDSLFRHPHGKVLLRLPIPSRTWVAYGVLRTLPAVAVMAFSWEPNLARSRYKRSRGSQGILCSFRPVFRASPSGFPFFFMLSR